ncbi:MAG: thiamine pyrophosphate-dependent enzyme [Byssovorax sp.]
MSHSPSSPRKGAHRALTDTDAPDVIKVLRDDGTLDPARDPGLSSDEVRRLYRACLLTRRLDERLIALHRQGRIGFHIGSLGEEATILGSAYALRAEDWILPCYREFGAALLRGMPLARYLDNMFGNAADPAKGRQMPDHACYRPAHYASVSSPIGTQITHAAGVAWAAKIKKDDVVALAYFGEGATSSADFHNGINFAGVFKVPAVFVCRNNGWAISVPAGRQTATETFAEKGVAYGVPGVRVDGNDLFAMIHATRAAVASASRGEGPTLIEALTYRLEGHSTSDDPRAYRAEAELLPWKQLDPLPRLRRHLEVCHGFREADDQAMVAEVDAEIRAEVTAAGERAIPAIDSLFDDVFADLPWHLAEQREHLRRGPRARGH